MHALVLRIYLSHSCRNSLLTMDIERSLRVIVRLLISLHIFSHLTHKLCKLGGALPTLYGRNQASVIPKRVICS